MKRSIVFGTLVAIAAGVMALTSGTTESSRPSNDRHIANNYFGPHGPTTTFVVNPPNKSFS